MEGNKSGCSVKDRIAYYMIKMAEEEGLLTKDKIILEPTSGQHGDRSFHGRGTKGYRCLLTLPGMRELRKDATPCVRTARNWKSRARRSHTTAQ